MAELTPVVSAFINATQSFAGSKALPNLLLNWL